MQEQINTSPEFQNEHPEELFAWWLEEVEDPLTEDFEFKTAR